MDTRTSVAEYHRRIKLLQKIMGEKELQAVLLFQTADLFYFAGTAPSGHLFVPAEGDPCLLVYGGWDRAREEAVWQPVIPVRSFRELGQRLRDLGYEELKRLGTEMDVIPLTLYERYLRLFPGSTWEDVGPDIRRLRMKKSEMEIEAVKTSARLHKRVFAYVREIIRPGMTELEIAARLEGYARELGHQGRVRFRGMEQGLPAGVVASGPNGCQGVGVLWTIGGRGLTSLYPWGASRRTWQEGEPLLVDYAGVYTDYLVDQTRVYFAGTVADILLKAQAVAEEIAASLAEVARPGVTAGELYSLAEARARKAGLEEYFMGYEVKAGFVGHGVGLELNEWPVLASGESTVLEEGMVLSIEPKFVFPGQGAVGVEDTYVVTGKGAVRLTEG